MKILSWNCRGNFRNKYQHISREHADIYVIQECENPEKYLAEFQGFLHNYIWVGENDNKGLAVFATSSNKLEKLIWKGTDLRYYLPIRVNDSFDLIAVWSHPPYIEGYFDWQKLNIKKFNEDTIIIGDFNSNAQWNHKHGNKNHTEVVNQLAEIGLFSAYHYLEMQSMGAEKAKTFYQYGHLDKGHHIDYCFLSPDNLDDFVILSPKDWLHLSDHVPIYAQLYVQRPSIF